MVKGLRSKTAYMVLFLCISTPPQSPALSGSSSSSSSSSSITQYISAAHCYIRNFHGLPSHKCLLRNAIHNFMLVLRIVVTSGLTGDRREGKINPTSEWSSWLVSLDQQVTFRHLTDSHTEL